MRKHILYSYVEGCELGLVDTPITISMTELVTNRKWISGEAWVVNQQQGNSSDDGSRELGLNMELPDPYQEPEGWFTDIEEIAIVCNNLARLHHRSFVIGISDQMTKVSDDLFHLDGGFIDIERLKAVIGVKPQN